MGAGGQRQRQNDRQLAALAWSGGKAASVARWAARVQACAVGRFWWLGPRARGQGWAGCAAAAMGLRLLATLLGRDVGQAGWRAGLQGGKMGQERSSCELGCGCAS